MSHSGYQKHVYVNHMMKATFAAEKRKFKEKMKNELKAIASETFEKEQNLLSTKLDTCVSIDHNRIIELEEEIEQVKTIIESMKAENQPDSFFPKPSTPLEPATEPPPIHSPTPKQGFSSRPPDVRGVPIVAPYLSSHQWMEAVENQQPDFRNTGDMAEEIRGASYTPVTSSKKTGRNDPPFTPHTQEQERQKKTFFLPNTVMSNNQHHENNNNPDLSALVFVLPCAPLPQPLPSPDSSINSQEQGLDPLEGSHDEQESRLAELRALFHMPTDLPPVYQVLAKHRAKEIARDRRKENSISTHVERMAESRSEFKTTSLPWHPAGSTASPRTRKLKKREKERLAGGLWEQDSSILTTSQLEDEQKEGGNKREKNEIDSFQERPSRAVVTQTLDDFTQSVSELEGEIKKLIKISVKDQIKKEAKSLHYTRKTTIATAKRLHKPLEGKVEDLVGERLKKLRAELAELQNSKVMKPMQEQKRKHKHRHKKEKREKEKKEKDEGSDFGADSDSEWSSERSGTTGFSATATSAIGEESINAPIVEKPRKMSKADRLLGLVEEAPSTKEVEKEKTFRGFFTGWGKQHPNNPSEPTLSTGPTQSSRLSSYFGSSRHVPSFHGGSSQGSERHQPSFRLVNTARFPATSSAFSPAPSVDSINSNYNNSNFSNSNNSPVFLQPPVSKNEEKPLTLEANPTETLTNSDFGSPNQRFPRLQSIPSRDDSDKMLGKAKNSEKELIPERSGKSI